MTAKRRLIFVIGIVFLGAILCVGAFTWLPEYILPLEQKPEPSPPKSYDYFTVMDAENEETLMVVPLKVNIGDELITDKNKRYQVVRIEENRAYARFVENVNLEPYSPKKQ